MEQKTNNSQNPGGKNNKTLWFSMLGALLLIILVVAAPRLKRESGLTEAPEDSEVADAEVVLPNQDSVAPKSLTKTDAVIKYEGRRISFGENCQAMPTTISVKAGTSIMLDNQSGTPRTIKVAGKTFAIGAYKYRTTVLDTPGALPVSCDMTENAAAIIIE